MGGNEQTTTVIVVPGPESSPKRCRIGSVATRSYKDRFKSGLSLPN